MPKNYLPEETVKILEEQFRKNDYIPGEEVMHQLEKATERKPGQISSWFNRERVKRKKAALLMAKEGKIAELEALLNAKDAEIESLRGQTAALQRENAALNAKLGQLEQQQTLPPLHESFTDWSLDPDVNCSWSGEPSQLGP